MLSTARFRKLWQIITITTIRKMDQIRKTQKQYCSSALMIAIFACFFCLLIGQVPVGKGLLLGTIFSILNFILMGESLPYRLGKSKRKTVIASLGSIGFRYIILAVPIVTAIKHEQFNLYSAIIGIFSVQIVLLADHLFTYTASARKTARQKHT